MLRNLAISFMIASAAPAVDFSFNLLIRAGLSGPGDWEIGMGLNPSGVPSVSAQLSPYYANGSPQRFEIGYDASAQQAYTRVYTDTTTNTRVVNLLYNVPGAAPLSNGGLWTLPASSFYASASVRAVPTSITVDNMALTTAAGVLQPATLTGSNDGITAVRSTQPAAIVFQPQAGGSWMLSGNMTLVGLSAYAGPGGAQRSQLQFGLNAQASETPEPASFILVATALVLTVLWRRRRLQTAVARMRSQTSRKSSQVV